MPFWDEVVRQTFEDHMVDLRLEHVDAPAARLVMSPRSFDVIPGSNLFADILSDLAAGVCGSIGIAPSADLDPTGQYPSMFEPVHGSAPDIAGQELANPIGMLRSVVLLLDHLRFPAQSARLMSAIEFPSATPPPGPPTSVERPVPTRSPPPSSRS